MAASNERKDPDRRTDGQVTGNDSSGEAKGPHGHAINEVAMDERMRGEASPESQSPKHGVSEFLERERREDSGRFDVFLCHHSKDKPAVRDLYMRLTQRGLLPWLNEKELFDQGCAAEPPSDPLRRQIWERLNENRLGGCLYRLVVRS